MTRAEEIRSLKLRYLRAVSERKHKTASLIYARLRSMMARQLNAEIREERKRA